MDGFYDIFDDVKYLFERQEDYSLSGDFKWNTNIEQLEKWIKQIKNPHTRDML